MVTKHFLYKQLILALDKSINSINNYIQYLMFQVDKVIDLLMNHKLYNHLFQIYLNYFQIQHNHEDFFYSQFLQKDKILIKIDLKSFQILSNNDQNNK
jgi:hypothetical protein